MIGSCISAACALGLVLLGLLVMTRVVSLEEAAKAIGRIALIVILALVAVCVLRQPVVAGLLALVALLKALLLWLVVTVFVIALLILFVRILLPKFVAQWSAQSTTKTNRNGGDL